MKRVVRMSYLVPSAVLLAVAASVVLGVFAYYYYFAPRHWDREAFNQRRWLTASPDERGAMVFDLLPPGTQPGSRAGLLAASRFAGMGKPDVLNLLGEPDRKDADHAEYWTYDLGPLGSNPRDPFGTGRYYLWIEFDAQGAVAGVSLAMGG